MCCIPYIIRRRRCSYTASVLESCRTCASRLTGRNVGEGLGPYARPVADGVLLLLAHLGKGLLVAVGQEDGVPPKGVQLAGTWPDNAAFCAAHKQVRVLVWPCSSDRAKSSLLFGLILVAYRLCSMPFSRMRRVQQGSCSICGAHALVSGGIGSVGHLKYMRMCTARSLICPRSRPACRSAPRAPASSGTT